MNIKLLFIFIYLTIFYSCSTFNNFIWNQDLQPTKSSSPLLDLLTTSLDLHNQGKYNQSNLKLLSALKMSKPNLFKNHFSMKKTKIYLLEIHEHILIYIYLMLNSIQQQEWSQALNYAQEGRDSLSKLAKIYDHNYSYQGDMVLSYLSGIIYEQIGEYEKAYQIYKHCLVIHDNNRKKLHTYKGVTPFLYSDLFRLATFLNKNKELSFLNNKFKKTGKKEIPTHHDSNGEIIVIHQIGKSPFKSNDHFYYSYKNQVVGYNFPIYKKQRYYVHNSELFIPTLDIKARSYLLQDYSEIAIQSLEDRRKLLERNVFRKKKKGETNINMLDSLSIFNASTSQIETRYWSTLPSKIKILRLFVPPGTYKPTISFLSRFNQPNIKTNLPALKIEKSKKYFIYQRTF